MTRKPDLRAVFRAALVFFLLAAVPQGVVAAPMSVGFWVNPKGSVVVQTGECGPGLCGRVVWASQHALEKARSGGVANLLGIQLLQDYRPSGAGLWHGTVYVPDMGRSFDSDLEQVSPTQIKIKGCVMGGLICRSQIWTRIRQLPA
ncbi:DUF2147 domain-containing protein [Novosphingobium sp. Leaf2]|uniref:DUF2147 domain-containing protein n=1 Tax=Novosphingobium sp. Leaf2 TaxID=1735670 RepID=UPI0006FBE0D9|nr:DUF2147 domain-containing protein [Novosphingobium sp. Leaf2]KQM19454.1 hypothetical protein ASE49_04280 [Novosphingobium sp. Leaf2]